MSEKNKDTTQDNPHKREQIPATTEYVEEAPDNIKNTENKEAGSDNINKEPVKVIVNISNEDKGYKRSEIIAIWVAVVIQAILAVFTYLLFNKTKEANNTSSRALKVSEQALEDSRINSRVRDSLDSIIRGRDFIRDSTNIEISKQSLLEQVKSIKETQNQFKIMNEPRLEIDSIYMTFIKGKTLAFNVVVRNLSKYPVRILGTAGACAAAFNEPIFNNADKDLFNDVKESSLFITYEKTHNFYWDDSPRIFNEETHRLLDLRKYFIYFAYFIKYENLITGEKKLYKSVVKYTNGPYNEPDILFNDSFDLTKK